MKLRGNRAKIEIKSASAHSQCSGAGTKHHTESHVFIFVYSAQLLHAMDGRGQQK